MFHTSRGPAAVEGKSEAEGSAARGRQLRYAAGRFPAIGPIDVSSLRCDKFFRPRRLNVKELWNLLKSSFTLLSGLIGDLIFIFLVPPV